jgi:hypothetical protein
VYGVRYVTAQRIATAVITTSTRCAFSSASTPKSPTMRAPTMSWETGSVLLATVSACMGFEWGSQPERCPGHPAGVRGLAPP